MVGLRERFKRLFIVAASLWVIYLLFLLPLAGRWLSDRYLDAEVTKCWKQYVPDGETAINADALRSCREKARVNAAKGVHSGLDFDWDEGERWSFDAYYSHMGRRLIGLILGPPAAGYGAAQAFFWISEHFVSLCLSIGRGSKGSTHKRSKPNSATAF